MKITKKKKNHKSRIHSQSHLIRRLQRSHIPTTYIHTRINSKKQATEQPKEGGKKKEAIITRTYRRERRNRRIAVPNLCATASTWRTRHMPHSCNASTPFFQTRFLKFPLHQITIKKKKKTLTSNNELQFHR